jgi:hypothetical protein
MHKQLHTALIVAGLLVIGTQGHAAEPPGVIKMQDLMAAATKNKFDDKSVVAPKSLKRGGFCTGYPGEKMRCEHLGRIEVNQIYEQGWRVVTAYQADRTLHVLFIEEQ